jgi:two-component system LytT family response regulator
VAVVATCKSGTQGLEAIAAYDPDFIFLDIAMPRMTGFEMLAQVDAPDFDIIFTTAYDAFALQAFKVSAIDYLLKPIDKDEFIQAIQKVKSKLTIKHAFHEPGTHTRQWQMFLENVQNQGPSFPNIALPTGDGIEMVPAMEIMYIVADGNYCTLHMRDSKPILLSRTLKEMETTLQAYPFVRVHHSHLVNTIEIKKYVRGEGGYIILNNGHNINVSRRRKLDLLNALKQV